MAPPHTMQLAGPADRALMTAIRDALRRDPEPAAARHSQPRIGRARWGTLRSQLCRHLGAEHAAMWPRVRSKLAGDSCGQALLDALDDERQLLGPLQAMIDDAFTTGDDLARCFATSGA